MACTYTGSIEGDRALASSEHLTEVTDMLCRVLTNLELAFPKGSSAWKTTVPDDVEKFWVDHKEIDAKRKRAEKKELRKSALAKLTDDEREALGL